nr:hypothetical protein BaRGS_027291 [Batillaria attramentaria]
MKVGGACVKFGDLKGDIVLENVGWGLVGQAALTQGCVCHSYPLEVGSEATVACAGADGVSVDVEHSHVRFLGNLVLNLWDCGGQEAFMENYFASQRDNIFRNVEVLIYVFDVESRELEKDMHYYQSCLEAILQNSPDAKIFCLVHKMDLVQDDQREVQLEANLTQFGDIIDADEVLLFERATFLVISYSERRRHRGWPSFLRKSADIIKQFTLICSKMAAIIPKHGTSAATLINIRNAPPSTLRNWKQVEHSNRAAISGGVR